MGGNGTARRPKPRPLDDLDERLLDPTGGQMHKPPIFPGFEGLPFRGEVYDVKTGDPEYAQPQTGAKAHVDVLNLAKPDDLKRYRDICQMVANGFAKISQERLDFDGKKYVTFIRWLEMFAYNPKKGLNHGRTG
jgi:hypothetical protein